LRARILIAFSALTVLVGVITVEAPGAAADVIGPVCGPSGAHQLCLTAPSDVLTGEQTITVTNSPNAGTVIFSWLPDGKKAAIFLQTSFASNPSRPQNYTFVWPTQKYADAIGSLRAQFGSTSNAAVSIHLTLSNGNAAGTFQRNAQDWAPPAPWTGMSDPVVAAVGDAASNEKASNAVADSIVAANPALFLYLGDVYEEATFTEFRNHYGLSAQDDPAAVGTLWGRLARITEATFGNHEVHNQSAFFDYWHRPQGQFWTMFEFGGAWFFDLWSGTGKFDVGTQQYNEVQAKLQTLAPNTCVLAFWHRPVTVGGTTRTGLLPMWQLLANNGGDVVMNGDAHFMAQYRPLDANLDPTTPEAHMVQFISGAGGHVLSPTKADSTRIAWPTTALKQSGALYLTLNGVANGGIATSISFDYRNATGTQIPGSAGSVTC
jgi:hypothetical protein